MPKDAVEDLMTAVLGVTTPDALPDEPQALAMTESLRSALSRLPSSRVKPRPTTPADIDPTHDQMLRAVNVAYRRGGVLLRTRAGDDALADPHELLRRCAATYWSLKGVDDVNVYVALAVAEGIRGAALIERVTVAAGRQIDGADREIAECLRELETCGGMAVEPLTGAALRSFASLVLQA
ncbi:hypothetical protein [Agromyces humatus]|uniref:Uncharacterized protein n=1 Tax=Agromyces humatus TaxID=279573 RepID=A0ABN2KKZ9_9MICO|nr:hypothetical protein [Agromyces humatus]